VIDRQQTSAAKTALIGLLSLAAAMGIGRFAFTPMFPLMHDGLGLTLAQGSWLATANYAGYFLGAVTCFLLVPDAAHSARWGLVAVAISTIAMGWAASFPLWIALRLVAGVASAFVLVGASGWALAQLASRHRNDLGGWVFAGVGVGICMAGAIALVAGTAHAAPESAWSALGAVALAVTASAWRLLAPSAPVGGDGGSAATTRLKPADWLLVACYGAFGFGYIIPATFIPAAARAFVQDPWVFGWVWPLFGLAAAVSTVLVTTVFRNIAPRRTAIASLLVMAVGVALPAARSSIDTLVVSAICVGGTFMVMTMAGFQEAKRVSTGSPTRLISAMTAAFAVGQLAGPVTVGLGLRVGNPLVLPSIAAAVLLACSAVALALTQRHGAAPPPLPHEGRA
jgi:predicted MFS family arabinose efflux permease